MKSFHKHPVPERLVFCKKQDCFDQMSEKCDVDDIFNRAKVMPSKVNSESSEG